MAKAKKTETQMSVEGRLLKLEHDSNQRDYDITSIEGRLTATASHVGGRFDEVGVELLQLSRDAKARLGEFVANVKERLDALEADKPYTEEHCDWCDGSGKTDINAPCPHCNGTGHAQLPAVKNHIAALYGDIQDIRHSIIGVRRAAWNDPCNCHSGKKYKKCCGKR